MDGFCPPAPPFESICSSVLLVSYCIAKGGVGWGVCFYLVDSASSTLPLC